VEVILESLFGYCQAKSRLKGFASFHLGSFNAKCKRLRPLMKQISDNGNVVQ